MAHKLGMEAIQFTSDDYEPRTRQRHEQTILNFYGYKRFDNDALISIENEDYSLDANTAISTSNSVLRFCLQKLTS